MVSYENCGSHGTVYEDVFLDVMCILENRQHNFGGICCLCVRGRVEDEGSVLLKSTDT